MLCMSVRSTWLIVQFKPSLTVLSSLWLFYLLLRCNNIPSVWQFLLRIFWWCIIDVQGVFIIIHNFHTFILIERFLNMPPPSLSLVNFLILKSILSDIGVTISTLFSEKREHGISFSILSLSIYLCFGPNVNLWISCRQDIDGAMYFFLNVFCQSVRGFFFFVCGTWNWTQVLYHLSHSPSP
jgi:hypothetical protein